MIMQWEIVWMQSTVGNSRKTRNGARRTIESFYGEGYRKRSSKLVSIKTFQALLQITGGINSVKAE